MTKGLVFGIALVTAAGCGRAPAPPASEVVVVRRATLAADPGNAGWAEVPAFPAALLLQDMVEPRLLEPSTSTVEVRAMSDGSRVAFRLAWADPTRDDVPGTGRFSDACAVQLPVTGKADVPAPQMGESGRPVEITYWRAFWQSAVDGREDSIHALYPGATVDHYPFEAPALAAGSAEREEMAQRYAPARALGNRMAGPRAQPVENLIAEGPGTLRPAGGAGPEGRGSRTDDGWAVVLVRALPAGLAPGRRSQVAFAVWEGAHGETGARKMRSAWIPLAMAEHGR